MCLDQGRDGIVDKKSNPNVVSDRCSTEYTLVQRTTKCMGAEGEGPGVIPPMEGMGDQGSRATFGKQATLVAAP